MGVSRITPARVLMTADAAGGVWRYTVDFVNGLVRRGINVLVASLGPRPSREQRQQLLRFPGIDLREGDFALEWMPDPWRDVDASSEWLLGLQGEFGADLIHLNGYSHAALPWREPVLVVAHSCVCSWWRAVHGCTPGPDWDEYKRRVKSGLLACHAIAAPSRFMANAMNGEYGISESKIHVIHNFSRARASGRVRKEPFILAAGRLWDQAKNFQLLERIADQLSWKLRIAATLPHALLQREMSRASIFVHPALYEPFGLSILEAARRRCALVLSDIPSLRELWDGAALFLDPRDENQWIFELNRLSCDPAGCERLGGLAQLRAAHYSSTLAMRKYLDLYSTLMQSKRKEGAAAA